MQLSLAFRFVSLVVLLAALIALLGCSPAATPTRVIAPIVTPLVIPTNLPPPVDASPTPVIPTVAPALIPTPMTAVTPGRIATPTRGPTPAPGMMHVKIFLVALEDGGKAGKKIGCNDSIVPVERTIPVTQAVLTAALNDLFSLREQNYGQSGLYNALHQSDLKVANAAVIGGKATIYLTGAIKLGGACDNPRVEAQIKETALQFSTVKTVAVFVNNTPLEKILSEKGN